MLSDSEQPCFSVLPLPPEASSDFPQEYDFPSEEFVSFPEDELRESPVEVQEWFRELPSLDKTGVTSQFKESSVEEKRWLAGQSMAAKFEACGDLERAKKFRECHSYSTVRTCSGCSKRVSFWNRCDVFFCPQCSPRLSSKRLQGLMWFVEKMAQPKHVVLTFVNVSVLSKEYLKWCVSCLQRLRRRSVMKAWVSGLWAMEITNEGNGWHVHFHLVVDGGYVSQAKLSHVWSEICADGSRITFIRSASAASARKMLPIYVTKYAGKGFRPADWTAEMLCQFASAVDGVRTFGVFGRLYKARGEFRAWLESIRNCNSVCECGCRLFSYRSPQEIEWAELRAGRSPSVKAKLGFNLELPLKLALDFPR